MNIFIVDEDPKVAAEMLCDRHVNKMILETAQMLSSVAHRYDHPTLYKPTHKNHPCTIWAGDSYENWMWLVEHGLALESEKIYRTGRGHKSAELIRWYRDNGYGPKNKSGLTPFARAMPDKYKAESTSESYRRYYLNDKQRFRDGKRPKWTLRNPPDWWKYE
jgi:hypothetical protein